MTFPAFENIINVYKQLKKRCEKFDKLISKAINKPYEKGKYSSDSYSCLCFPTDAIEEVIKIILIDEGESTEGADWFIYDGITMIENGGTEIDNHKINSFEDYWNYVQGLKNCGKSENNVTDKKEDKSHQKENRDIQKEFENLISELSEHLEKMNK